MTDIFNWRGRTRSARPGLPKTSPLFVPEKPCITVSAACARKLERAAALEELSVQGFLDMLFDDLPRLNRTRHPFIPRRKGQRR